MLFLKLKDLELDFHENVNEYDDGMVRLYNTNQEESKLLYDIILEVILKKNQRLNFAEIPFVQPRNCNLIMGMYKEDVGILTQDNETFFCMLTRRGIEKLLNQLEPFCEKETSAHQYLYDIDTPIEFLYAPAGIW